MTGNRYLIDTNVVSAYLKGDTSVKNKMSRTESVFIPVIVIGELCFGAALSENTPKYLSDINDLKTVYRIIILNEDTCYLLWFYKSRFTKKRKTNT